MTRDRRRVAALRVDVTSYEAAAAEVLAWARAGESRYVCVANVHMAMEAHDDPAFRAIVDEADLVTPDGMPLVWALRLSGAREATRVYGPDLTPAVCARAEAAGVPVGFYGTTPERLRALVGVMRSRFPRLTVAYAESPPFHPLTPEEEAAAADAINASGARILFVGLGCPKQERWMARQRGRVGAVMLGVGLAFDLLAGAVPRAPRLVQAAGLEWGFRLLVEPRRLWHRYLYNNPRFLALLVAQALGGGRRAS